MALLMEPATQPRTSSRPHAQRLRILVLGSARWWRMEASVARALVRANHDVLLIDDRKLKRNVGRAITQRWVRWRSKRFNPQFVFLGKCLGLNIDTVEEVIAGRQNAMWYLDPQYYGETHRPEVAHVLKVAQRTDRFFVTGFEDEWARHGTNAAFLPAAALGEVKPVAPDARYDADVAFTGSAYDADRARFLIELSRHFRVRVWGNGWERYRDALSWGGRHVEGREFATVCSSARVVLGINPTVASAATNYASNRMWMSMLVGGFYMGQRTPGMDRMAIDGVHCAWYENLDACIAKISWYIAHPEERERIRREGERFVRSHHTFDQRIHNILRDEPFTNPL